MKEYHISEFSEKNGTTYVITKDIERRGFKYIVEDLENSWKKRYIINVGDKIIDIFGNVVTIKEIIHHESTKTTNYLVEENENTYNPWEFAGLYIRFITKDEYETIVGICKE